MPTMPVRFNVKDFAHREESTEIIRSLHSSIFEVLTPTTLLVSFACFTFSFRKTFCETISKITITDCGRKTRCKDFVTVRIKRFDLTFCLKKNN